MIANMNEISRRLKALREEIGYNQEGMAKITGMSQRAWDGWEEKPPKALMALAALCRHFGISADYFLGLIEDRQSYKDTSLPEGGSEVIGYMSEVSDRARQEIIELARMLHDIDQRWERYDRAVTMIEQMGGSALLDNLFAEESSALQQIRTLRLDRVTLILDARAGTIHIAPQE